MRKREVLGIALLIFGSTGIFLSIKNATPQYVYLTAKRDISPGEILARNDFRSVSLYLADAAVEYVGAEVNLDSHRSLRRIKSGEIIPRDAITRSREIESRGLITFPVESSKIPTDLSKGSVIDLYFFSRATLGVQSEQTELVENFPRLRIQQISMPTGQLDGDSLISIFVAQSDVSRLLQLISTCSISISQRFDDE